MRHVELEEAWAVTVGGSDGFDGSAAGCAEGVGEIEFAGGFGDWEFAVFVIDFVDADRGEADRGGNWENQLDVVGLGWG